ncbi:dehydrogenase [Rhodotorula diobovata]|uniref:Dehydrogenase n=1 Tax=Rhodotorula diobovata TaxID=5288 RepID=A0A5C5FXR8_9BASI|nr:dehydrogenase [Rhodotorula diobovata]
MSTFTYLITGASRGLGLGYSKALLASDPRIRVVAAARNPSAASDLQALANEEANKGRIHLLQLDVEDKDKVAQAVKELEASGFVENGIDALVLNAGVAAESKYKPSEIEPEHVLANLGVNLFGVLNVTKAFLPLVRQGKGKQIFTVSSVCGSVEEFGKNTVATGYCISKSAVTMWTAKLAAELGPEGFTVIPFHPGYVSTGINGHSGTLTVEEAAAEALKNVFQAAKPELNGSFLRYSGGTVPW